MYSMIIILVTLGGHVSQAQYGPFQNAQACESVAASTHAALAPLGVKASTLKIASDIRHTVAYCVKLL